MRDIGVLAGMENAVLKHARKDPAQRIFTSVPSHMDVHGCRRAFANAMYRSLARPVGELTQKEKYICRNDKRSVVYDRCAMLQVSRQLGHNRISVIAGHYLE